MSENALEPKINHPIVKDYSSDVYGRIVLDSLGVTHYWNHDGSYDGWASPPCIDGESGICLN